MSDPHEAVPDRNDAPSPADRTPAGRTPAGRTPADRAGLVAAAVCALQGLFLLGFCVFSLVELSRGGSDDAVRVVMEVVLIAVFAAGLIALARAWWAGRNWPNTPTIVWNALLLPVAWGLVQGGRGWVAVLVAGVAVAGIVAAIAADTSAPDDGTPDSR